MINRSRWVRQNFKNSREPGRPRSKRIHEYTAKDAARVRRKVFLALAVLAAIYLFYLFFYSAYAKISQFEFIAGNQDIKTEEVVDKIKVIMARHSNLIFRGDNYFTFKTGRLAAELNQASALASFAVSKKFPRTLVIQIEERLGRLLWVSLEQFYVLEAEGLISGLINQAEALSANLPRIYDLSNTPVVAGQTRINQQQLNLIMEVSINLKNYDLPQIEQDYFKVDSAQANYIKIVTKKGFELHLNYLNSFDSQIKKLKKSLASGKIDLNNIHYINLRIENQVIYR